MPQEAKLQAVPGDQGQVRQELDVPVEFAQAVREIEDGHRVAADQVKPKFFQAANGRRVLLK